MQDYTDKTVIITGSATGISKELVLQMDRESGCQGNAAITPGDLP